MYYINIKAITRFIFMLDLRLKWSADRKIFLIGYAVTSHYANKQYLLSWQDFFLDMSLHISIIERTVPCQHFMRTCVKGI